MPSLTWQSLLHFMPWETSNCGPKKKPYRTTCDIDGGGIEFIKNSPIILSVMVLDFLGNFFSSADTLLPFVARIF